LKPIAKGSTPHESRQALQLAKYNLGPKFAKAFEHLEKLSADAPLGRVDIDGPGLYISIAEYETASKAPTFLEVHRKYVDIQMTLSGEELLGWTTNASFPVDKPYDEAKDCEFLKVPASPSTPSRSTSHLRDLLP
jgi:YhcH/YjgK/YiaL family protein